MSADEQALLLGVPRFLQQLLMRNSDAPKTMIKQIAENASLYLVPGSEYDCLIPFIWDDSRRTEHHEEVIRGLRQIHGVVDAIIISRPGSMAVSLV